MTQQLSTPTAILLGFAVVGACVGAGIYFGLRDRAAPAATSSPPAERGGAPKTELASPDLVRQSREPERVDANPHAAVPPARDGAVVAPSSPDATRGEVAAALAKQKGALSAKCWPLAPKTLKEAKYSLNFTFGPDGSQIARGQAGHREASDPRVDQCLAESLEPVRISPRPSNTYVEIPFSIP